MKCLLCDSEDLKANVVYSTFMPLAMRHGTVKVGGHKVSQLDLKEAWDKVEGVDKDIKGPIYCMECGTEHYYVVGDQHPLKMGSYAEVVRRQKAQLKLAGLGEPEGEE
jgi:hypothetical protein